MLQPGGHHRCLLSTPLRQARARHQLALQPLLHVPLRLPMTYKHNLRSAMQRCENCEIDGSGGVAAAQVEADQHFFAAVTQLTADSISCHR